MAFAQKRKTLANNLRATGMAGDTISAALAQAGIAPQARAEALSIETFGALYNSLASGKAPVDELDK